MCLKIIRHGERMKINGYTGIAVIFTVLGIRDRPYFGVTAITVSLVLKKKI